MGVALASGGFLSSIIPKATPSVPEQVLLKRSALVSQHAEIGLALRLVLSLCLCPGWGQEVAPATGILSARQHLCHPLGLAG